MSRHSRIVTLVATLSAFSAAVATQIPTAPPPAAATTKAAQLPFERDLGRIAAIEKSRLEIENSLKGYYGTPGQLEKCSADIKALADIAALYKAHGTTGAHRSVSEMALAQMRRVQSTSRSVFASTMEETFMKKGLDIRFTTSGPENKILRLTYVLMSQPMVYQFQNEMKLPVMAQGIGFSRIIYSNGAGGSLGKSWTVDLSK